MTGTFKTFSLDLHPEYTVSLALFTSVTNAQVLREKLIASELNCALINVTYVPDILPVLLACNKAVHCYKSSSMKTRSIHTEVLYNLSPTNSIKDSLRTFGISGNESKLLCVVITKTDKENTLNNIVNCILGNLCSPGDLSLVSNVEKIKELYRIEDVEIETSSLTEAVIMRISTKDAL